MFNSSSYPGKLSFEKRVIGTSSRLQRDHARVKGEHMSLNNTVLLTPRSTVSPLNITLRGTNGCVMETLTADPPLSLENTTVVTRSSNQKDGDALFLSTDEVCGVEDDSVVVEMMEPSSPLVCPRTSMFPSSRIAVLTLGHDHLSSSGVGEFTSSPNKRSKSGSKRVNAKDTNDCNGRAGLRWQNSSVGGFTHSSIGGVTHSSVTRSQDSVERGPMRVSLAHKALIGKGSFGVVFQAMDRDTNHIIAVKEISVTNKSNNKALEAVRKELALLKLLDHPHIVKCLGEECDENCLRIYLEYVSGGSISSVLRTFGPFQEKQASIYTRQMLEGLTYLHSKNIMHRDLKGDNLLVDPNGTLKISDFGTAKDLLDHNGSNALAGTAYFMAPEVILAQPVGLSSDVWSVGCCVIEMLTGSPPFSSVKNQYSMMMRVAQSTVELFPEMIPKEHNFSKNAIAFLQRCLQRDPSKRPQMHELLKDGWILFPPEDTEPKISMTKLTGKGRHSVDQSSVPDTEKVLRSTPPTCGKQAGVHPMSENGGDRRNSTSRHGKNSSSRRNTSDEQITSQMPGSHTHILYDRTTQPRHEEGTRVRQERAKKRGTAV